MKKSSFSELTRICAFVMAFFIAMSAASCMKADNADKTTKKAAPFEKAAPMTLPDFNPAATDSAADCLTLEAAAKAQRAGVENIALKDSLTPGQIKKAVDKASNGDISLISYMVYVNKIKGGLNSDWFVKESVKKFLSTSNPAGGEFFGAAPERDGGIARIALGAAMLMDYRGVTGDTAVDDTVLDALDAIVSHPKEMDSEDDAPEYDIYGNSLLSTALRKASEATGQGATGDSAEEIVSRINVEVKKAYPSSLRDAAATIAAHIDDYEGTGDTIRLEDAEQFSAQLIKRFWNDEAGAFASVADKEPRFCPTDNAMAADALARVYHLSGNTEFRDRALKAMGLFAGKWSGPYVEKTLHRISTHPLKATVIGDKSDPATDALRAAVAAFYEPNKIVETLDPVNDKERLEKLPYRAQDEPVLYACVETACSMPVTDPQMVASHMKKFVDKYLYGDKTNSVSGKLINNKPSGGGAMFQKP